MNIVITTIIIFIFLLLNLCNKQNKKEDFNNKKYNLAIMAIFKNEEEYMKEWLEHHINQGFDHFYLYCNDPDLDKYTYLKNKKYSQYITLIPWTDVKNDGKDTIQRKAYTHCVQNYNNEFQFIMMLDIDEFIIHTNINKKVKDFLNSIYNEWNKTKAIKVQRYNFSSDGHLKKPYGKVVDNYKNKERICSSYKTIANSNFIDTKNKFYGVHDFRFLNIPGKIYNSYFSYKHTGYNGPNECTKDDINEIPLVINHYYSKSYDEFMKRCQLWKDGGVNNINYRKDCKNTFLKNEKKIYRK